MAVLVPRVRQPMVLPMLLQLLTLAVANKEAAPESEGISSWAFLCFQAADLFATATSQAAPPILPFPIQEAPAKRSGVRRFPAEIHRLVLFDNRATAEFSAPGEPVKHDTVATVSERLRRFDGQCFFMRVGYWTYEVNHESLPQIEGRGLDLSPARACTSARRSKIGVELW
eukprot:5170556-Pleurochrysis_carterae.AAC.6